MWLCFNKTFIYKNGWQADLATFSLLAQLTNPHILCRFHSVCSQNLHNEGPEWETETSLKLFLECHLDNCNCESLLQNITLIIINVTITYSAYEWCFSPPKTYHTVRLHLNAHAYTCNTQHKLCICKTSVNLMRQSIRRS